MTVSTLGHPSMRRKLRSLTERTQRQVCDVLTTGQEDGRGGYTGTEVYREDVLVTAKPLPNNDATELIGRQREFQAPHLFVFSHDEDLPDDCYVRYEGTVYREETRRQTGSATHVVTVRDG